MEEKLKENNEEVKKEKQNKEPSLKTKRRKAKIAVISLSTFVVLFVGLQAYASTNGYGNVFFMIKEWVTGEKVVEEDKIFSDQEITLSYKSIELAEGLKIQANRLEIKDGKTKLYAVVKSEDSKKLPLKYEIHSEYKEGTSETSSTIKKITGEKPQNAEKSYTEVLELDYAIKENATLVVKINDTNDKELKTLEINLETREITVKGEGKTEKISKIELRKYLDAVSLLNDPSNYTESDNLIEISTKIQAITDSKILIKRETINEIVREFYGDKAKFETVKDAKGKDVEVLKNMRVGIYDKESDDYELMEHDRLGKCLKIESASYENGAYTIKYIYTLADKFDEDKDNLEDLPQYETTVKLKRVEENKYSKYQLIDIESGKQIKEKVDTTVTEKEQNIEDDFDFIFTDENNDLNNTTNNTTSNNTTDNSYEKPQGNTKITYNTNKKYSGRIVEELNWEVTKEKFTTIIFGFSGIVPSAMIDDKDFSKEEFTDYDIARILPELDVYDAVHHKITIQDGKNTASEEDIQEMAKKYFGRTIDISKFSRSEADGKIILSDCLGGINSEYRPLGAYYIGQDYLFVFEYRNKDKSAEKKLYTLRLEFYQLAGEEERAVFKGITNNANEYNEWRIYNLFEQKLINDIMDQGESVEYKIDKIEILSEENKKEIENNDSGWKDAEALAIVHYSIKPENINNSKWVAGSGIIEGEWINGKISCVGLRYGDLVGGGTNF